jgi:hypothetical protein
MKSFITTVRSGISFILINLSLIFKVYQTCQMWFGLSNPFDISGLGCLSKTNLFYENKTERKELR